MQTLSFSATNNYSNTIKSIEFDELLEHFGMGYIFDDSVIMEDLKQLTHKV